MLAEELERRVLARTSRRIVPFIVLLYFVSFLDRVNVGFAAITMNRDIGLTAQAFGIGAGIFFFGYAMFEVPSNLALFRFGARLWIARVMITWGLVSGATAFVQGPITFYVARFLLGLAEAGFFPGIILYLSYWFPTRHRGRVTALFMIAAPLASMIGSPISAFLLGLQGFLGLHGWQWVFLIEAVPSVVLGLICMVYLTDRPAEARWLKPDEKAWLMAEMDSEAASRNQVHASIWHGLSDLRVLRLAAVYFGTSVGLYTVNIWGPLLLGSYGAGVAEIGWLNALLSAVAIVGMVLWSIHSDRTRERQWHIIVACLTAAIGLALAGIAHTLPLLVVGLSLASFGVNAAKPPFWTLPSEFLSGAAAAAGIALINSLGTLGGAVGPALIGFARQHTESHLLGLCLNAGIVALSGLILIPVRAIRVASHRNARSLHDHVS